MNGQAVKYYLDESARFVVENYNWAKPFHNFLPGIGGDWGIPIWLFYVNRAQCVSSMGVGDKDGAILEFHSFNNALQLTNLQGFRTFLKISGDAIYEPFQKSRDHRIIQNLTISSEQLVIHESNPNLGIETAVRYFPLVGEPTPALIRELRVRNLGSHGRAIELIDGLPRILPYGMNQQLVKFTPRHTEGMMGVDDLDGIPIFRLKQTPEDVPQIGRISGGNFYFSFLEGEAEILRGHFIVDPSVIFGGSEAYDYPWQFEADSIDDLLSMAQTRENKTPCAFTAVSSYLPQGGEVVLYSFVGNTTDETSLRLLLEAATKASFVHLKSEENRSIIEAIKSRAFTVSSSQNFDHFCQQTFLDNVIRGGTPWVVDTARGKSVFYTYSRKHGDLERDYNNFVLEPTYLSQGEGYYRDVNQNRRSDVWFFPEVEDSNIVTFLSLLQTDGYNPQVVQRVTYTAEDTPELRRWLRSRVGQGGHFQELLQLVTRPFTPGEFVLSFERGTERNTTAYEWALREVLSFCSQNDVGGQHEGFWVDHWTYNLDLIDRFLEIYPDRLQDILLEREVFSFYDNSDVVVPRNRKYVLVDGEVRQSGAVARDQEKSDMIEHRHGNPTLVRTRGEEATVYHCNLLVKLLSVVANKIATLDPQGMGIMMEADKPGWCDPLNGLPALFGSSICETLELERLCRFLRESLDQLKVDDDRAVKIYEELYRFLASLGEEIEKRLTSCETRTAQVFWDRSHELKERYREQTRMGVACSESLMTVAEVKTFLNRALRLLAEATGSENEGKLFDKTGVNFTYFANEVTRYEPVWEDGQAEVQMLSEQGYPLVKASQFGFRPLPIFLEGPVHLLRVHPHQRERIYGAVRQSGLYDRKLRMYKTCDALNNEPIEIGRIRAYAPGWIENGSIYLHMEYKWLLELLRSGLHKEFYEDLENTFIPFLDPEVYGRSILETSSYIVSSDFPDEKLHGRGFQPRLSGSTCEALHMWTLMVAGENPFFLSAEGQLGLQLRPILPGRLFTQEERTCQLYDMHGEWTTVVIPRNAFGFRFIGKSLVVYHNAQRKDTFGEAAAQVVSYRLEYHDGRQETVSGGVLGASNARDVREGRVDRIDVDLS